MAFAENAGVQLAYERVGNRDGGTVAFVEGLGYGRWMWQWQQRALEDEFDLILWDNRGTGESDAPDGPYTIPDMAGDLEAVLSAAGVDSAHVIGASMGGMIAQQFALDYDRAQTLSLLCTTPGGPEEIPIPDATLERMFGVPDGYDEREAIRYKMQPAMTPEFWKENDDLIEEIIDWRLEMDAADQPREWQGAAVEQFDVRDRLDALTTTTQIIPGERDPVVPLGNGRLLAEGIPNASFETVDDGGSHLFFIERADEINERLSSFIHSH
jgi:pimeloyl-ACP methyl ester carboxylesterase